MSRRLLVLGICLRAAHQDKLEIQRNSKICWRAVSLSIRRVRRSYENWVLTRNNILYSNVHNGYGSTPPHKKAVPHRKLSNSQYCGLWRFEKSDDTCHEISFSCEEQTSEQPWTKKVSNSFEIHRFRHFIILTFDIIVFSVFMFCVEIGVWLHPYPISSLEYPNVILVGTQFSYELPIPRIGGDTFVQLLVSFRWLWRLILVSSSQEEFRYEQSPTHVLVLMPLQNFERLQN